jgi:hypothetical protein
MRRPQAKSLQLESLEDRAMPTVGIGPSSALTVLGSAGTANTSASQPPLVNLNHITLLSQPQLVDPSRITFLSSDAGDAAVGSLGNFSQPPESPNQHFVTQLYESLLHRPPDPGGLASFSSLLDRGVATREQVVGAIEVSHEYHLQAVGDLFARLLGRQADSAGLNTFSSFLDAGGTQTQVEAAILGSQEYYDRALQHSGPDPLGAHHFLNAIYEDVLGRPPDESGASAFSDLLLSGVDRSAVAGALLVSSEAYQHEVQSVYRTYLGRDADPDGLKRFTNALDQGAPREAIVAAILGSQEYLQASGMH